MKADSPRAGQNLYLVLDLAPGASQNEILHAYNRAKNTYSSDSVASYAVFDDDSKEGILEEIEEAFKILGNPSKRREYDIKMGFETWKDEDELQEEASSRIPANLEGAKSLLDQTKEILEKKRSLSIVRSEPSPKAIKVNPEFEKEIESCSELTGDFLKTVRLYRKMSEEEIAIQTKLSPGHIRAIEEEDSSEMHHAIYLRGHVRLICQLLGFPEPQEAAGSYVKRLMDAGKLSDNQF